MHAHTTLHEFKIPALVNGEIDFADFAGKKILLVNTASECGYTPQYAQLRELQDTFRDVLVVVGLPCNDFGGQEPGTDEVIQAFCETKYHVNFPLTEKVSIKGDNQHPIYKWLTHKSQNGVQDATIKWNFHKFLVDENGHLVTDFPSSIEPLSEDIINLL